MKQHVARVLFQQGGLVALVALVIYALIAPAHLSTGDNAEFAALGELGGTAHPPGYPLYVLWLHAWSWLPGETPAQTAALATVLLGATTLLVLHAACRAWGSGAFAASIAVTLVAAAPLTVRLSTEAEVFTMNALIAALILWLSARRGPLAGGYRAATLGLVAGLGLANHHTCVLLAPLGLLGVVRGIRESRHSSLAAAAAVAALLLGLTPYLYLLVAPDTRASWGHVGSFDALAHHFLRMDYGGPSQLGPVDRGGTASANLIALFGTLSRAFLWVPFAAGLVAFALQLSSRIVDRDASDTRGGWVALLGSFLLAGPLFVAKFNLHPDGVHAFITRRFHLLPMIVFAIPVAVGLHHAVARLLRHRTAPVRRAWQGAVVSTVLMIALIAVTLPGLAHARAPAIEQALRNMLLTLPPRAVVIGTPDELHFGMGYLQGALGQRPDVSILTWQLVGLPHIRKHAQQELGISIAELPEGSKQKLSVVVAEQILASGRPLYIDAFQGNIAASFPVYPEGLLYRVLPRGSALPSIDELFDINEQLFARFQFGYEFPHTEDVVPAYFHDAYAQTWRAIAGGLQRAGKKERAEIAVRLAETLAPR